MRSRVSKVAIPTSVILSRFFSYASTSTQMKTTDRSNAKGAESESSTPGAGAKGWPASKSAANDSALKTQANQALKAASTPTGERLPQQGDLGWIQAANIEQHLLPIADVSADQMENCSDWTRKEGNTPASE